MKKYQNIAICTSTLLLGATLSQAAVVYSQDFSASSPVDASGTIVSIVDDTLYDGNGQNINGGNAAAQSTNGDYTISLGASTLASDGNGFIFNADPSFVVSGQSPNNTMSGGMSVGAVTPGAGFAGIDQGYTFETGTITITDMFGAINTGTVAINAAALNVGGEFLSLNLIEIDIVAQAGDPTMADVILTIDYDAFADFASGGNEDITVTTNFGLTGGDGDLSGDIAPVTADNNVSVDDVFTHNLGVIAIVPEPSSTALLGLGGLALILRRRR